MIAAFEKMSKLQGRSVLIIYSYNRNKSIAVQIPVLKALNYTG